MSALWLYSFVDHKSNRSHQANIKGTAFLSGDSRKAHVCLPFPSPRDWLHSLAWGLFKEERKSGLSPPSHSSLCPQSEKLPHFKTHVIGLDPRIIFPISRSVILITFAGSLSPHEVACSQVLGTRASTSVESHYSADYRHNGINLKVPILRHKWHELGCNCCLSWTLLEICQVSPKEAFHSSLTYMQACLEKSLLI